MTRQESMLQWVWHPEGRGCGVAGGVGHWAPVGRLGTRTDGWAASFSEGAPEVPRPCQDGVRGWSPVCFSTSVDQTVPGVTSGSMRPNSEAPRGGPQLGSDCIPRVASVSGINAQARRLQRNRAKGTPALASGGARSPPTPRLRRTVSESSLSSATAQDPEERGQDTMRYSLYESPHLLLLQGYSQQHVSPPPRGPAAPCELTRRALDVLRVEGLHLLLAKSAVSSCGHSHPGDDEPVETGWWAPPRRAVLDAGGSGASPVLCFQSILHPGYSRRRQERAHPIPGSFSENCLPLSRWCLRPCRALALGTSTQAHPLVQRVDACERLLWQAASSAPCLRGPWPSGLHFPPLLWGPLAGWAEPSEAPLSALPFLLACSCPCAELPSGSTGARRAALGLPVLGS